MNEIIISIKPEWCRKIMTGQKTAEVRRTKPKLNTPFKCLIYCTKDAKSNELYKGKVVAEFVCDKIFNIDAGNKAEIIENSCLTVGNVWRKICLAYFLLKKICSSIAA